jgi:methyl-accepting chemotaxis protein
MFRLIKSSHINHLARHLDEYSEGNIYNSLSNGNYPRSMKGIVGGVEKLRRMIRLFYIDTGVSTGKVRGAVQVMNHALKSDADNVGKAAGHSGMAHSIAVDIVESSLLAESGINQIKSAAEVISSVAEEIHNDSSEARKFSESAYSAMDEAADAFRNLRQASQTMAEKVRKLSENTREIDSLLLGIQNIASQTDMLALNASIEAARAGNQGRGFSIVADEMQKLSGEASLAADSANRLLAQVNRGIHETADFVSAGENILKSGGDSVLNGRKFIHELLEKNISIEKKTAEAKTAAAEQLKSTAVIAEYSGKTAETCRLAVNHTDMVNRLMGMQRDLFDEIFSMGISLDGIADELVSAGMAVSVTEPHTDGGRGNVRARVDVLSPELNRLASQLAGEMNDSGGNVKCLEEILKSNDDLEAAWTNSSDGKFIVSIPPAGIANAGGREWFIKAMDGGLFVSEVYISAISRNPCITISLPLKKNGRISGVLGVDLKLKTE